MASNQTQHLKLCQWEADDEVLRTDFNADNAKLDAVVGRAAELAEAAYTPANPPCVAGVYHGDGAVSQFIPLGFTPSAVLVFSFIGATYDQNYNTTAHYGGLAVKGYNASVSRNEGVTTWKDGVTMLAVTAGGFRVASFSTVNLNDDNVHYYIAFR